MMAGTLLFAFGIALWSLAVLLVWALCRVAQMSDERPASLPAPPSAPTSSSADDPRSAPEPV